MRLTYLTICLWLLAVPGARGASVAGPLERAARLNNEGAILSDEERYLEAEAKYRAALGLIERHGGPGSADAARPLNNLALAYRRLGRLQDAESRYLESLAIRERTGDRIGAARVRVNLARLYLAQQRRAEAEAVLEEAAGVGELRAEVLHTRTALLIGAKRYGAAAETALAARGAWDARGWDAEAAQARAMRGEALRLAGRTREAIAELGQALSELRAAFGERHPEVGRVTAAYAKALKAHGERRRAKRLRAEARAILAETPDRVARGHIIDLRSGYTRSR